MKPPLKLQVGVIVGAAVAVIAAGTWALMGAPTEIKPKPLSPFEQQVEAAKQPHQCDNLSAPGCPFDPEFVGSAGLHGRDHSSYCTATGCGGGLPTISLDHGERLPGRVIRMPRETLVAGGGDMGGRTPK